MKTRSFGVLMMLPAFLWAQSSTQSSQTPKASSSSSAAKQSTGSPQRMQMPKAKVSGFELAPPKAGGTQIGGATRGIGSPTVLLAPRKGKAYDLNPLFQWTNFNSKVQQYTFRLLDSSGDETIFETKVSGATLKYPDDAPALTPGSDYFWTAAPSSGLLGEPAEPAEIVIVGEPERAEMKPILDQASDLPARAQIFADHLFWYDAVAAYTEILEHNPKDINARRQRAAIYEQLPQTQDAAKKDRAFAEK